MLVLRWLFPHNKLLRHLPKNDPRSTETDFLQFRREPIPKRKLWSGTLVIAVSVANDLIWLAYLHNSTRIQINCRLLSTSIIRVCVNDLTVTEDRRGSWLPSRERREVRTTKSNECSQNEFSFSHLMAKSLAKFGQKQKLTAVLPTKAETPPKRRRHRNRNSVDV